MSIIMNTSSENILVSQELIVDLKIQTTPCPMAYLLGWVEECRRPGLITWKCSITFVVGFLCGITEFNVTSLSGSNLIQGRPYHSARHAQYYGYFNTDR